MRSAPAALAASAIAWAGPLTDEGLSVVRSTVTGHQLIDVDNQEPGTPVNGEALREAHGRSPGSEPSVATTTALNVSIPQ